MTTSSYNGFSGGTRDQVQKVLNTNWATGEWKRPERCEVCGQTEGTIQGHLEDYGRPETYIPLCGVCHMVLHCRFRAPLMFVAYVTRVSRFGQRHVGTDAAYNAVQRLMADDWSAMEFNPTDPGPGMAWFGSLPTSRLNHPPRDLYVPEGGFQPLREDAHA